MVLPTEWRDIWRGAETEYVQSVEVDIFCLKSQLIEVSPNSTVRDQQRQRDPKQIEQV